MRTLFSTLAEYFPKADCIVKKEDLETIFGKSYVRNALNKGLLKQGSACHSLSTYCWLSD